MLNILCVDSTFESQPSKWREMQPLCSYANMKYSGYVYYNLLSPSFPHFFFCLFLLTVTAEKKQEKTKTLLACITIIQNEKQR